MKKIFDERIMGLQKKFGFEALFVGSFLMFIDFMVRIIFYKKGFAESIDLYLVMVLPWIYYFVRGALGGIFINRTKQEKTINKIIGVVFALILLVVSMIGLSNDGVLNLSTHPSFWGGFAVGIAMVAISAALLGVVAKRRQKKFEED